MNWLKQKGYSVLRKSERYTKTDMVYLASGTFWLTVGQVLSAGSSFLLAIAFAYFVPKDVYGNYKYILSVAGIIGTLGLTGMGTAIVQAVARKLDGTLIKAFWMQLKWSIFMVLISFGASIYYFYKDNATLGTALLIIGVVTPFLKATELYGGYLGGKGLFKTSTKFTVIKDLGSAAALLGALFFTQNVVVLVATVLLANLFFSTIFFLIIKRRVTDVTAVDYTSLAFSKHLSFINIFLNVSAQIDKVIIFHYLGAIELAIYSFALAVPKQIRSVAGMLGPLAMPKFSNRPAAEIKKGVYRKFLVSQAFLLPITVGYIILAPYIYQILFPQYVDSVIYSQIYALFIPLFGNLSEIALISKQAKRERYILSVGMSIFNMILMFTLVHTWSVMGVIVSIVVTKYISAILSLIFVRNLKDNPEIPLATQ